MDAHMLFGLNEEELKKKISEMEDKSVRSSQTCVNY